jgi:GYF domain 2
MEEGKTIEEGAREWYYTSGPDQAGPVTFEELKAKAAASELHPRNDMVWKQSMAEWVPAGELDNLFQKSTTDVAVVALASSISAMEETKPPEPEKIILCPGASRRWYFLLMILFPVLWFVICLTFISFFGAKLSSGFQKFFTLLGAIIPIWVVVDVNLSRLTNLGMNKLWVLLHLVPGPNLWLGYRVFACPAGYAKSRKMDPIGWFLSICYWLVVISCLAVTIVIPAMSSIDLEDSQYMKKLQDFRKLVEKAVKEPNEAEKPDEPPPWP